MSISHALLFLTYRCNLSCDFCLSFGSYWSASAVNGVPRAVSPARYLLGGAKDEMSTQDILDRVIPQCEEAGVRVVALSGGEVLVRKDARVIFKALGDSSMRWCLDSNLMLCSEVTAKSIVAAGCDRVYVSIDGRPEVHDRLRGNPKAFHLTAQGLSNLAIARRDAGESVAPASLNFVLQPGNEDEAPHLVRLAANFGIRDLGVQLLSQLSYDVAFAADRAAAALDEASSLGREFGVNVDCYPLAAPSRAELTAWFSKTVDTRFFSGCDYIYESLRIDPRGDVIPCVETVVGNVLTDDLVEIWNGEAYRAFRRNIKDGVVMPACKRCCNLKSSDGDGILRSKIEALGGVA